MWINCDIGERGAAHVIDDAILKYVDLVNLACGGHAGDLESVSYYAQLAYFYHLKMSAHISYPDRLNFGRKRMIISWAQLEESLKSQIGLYFEGVKLMKRKSDKWKKWDKLDDKFCKPHGALYHDLHQDQALAQKVSQLLIGEGFHTVVGMSPSIWLEEAHHAGLRSLQESFAERVYHQAGGIPRLSPRKYPWASMSSLGEAVAQGALIIKGEAIPLVESFSDHPPKIHTWVNKKVTADTLCIHSDSEIALDLARALREAIG